MESNITFTTIRLLRSLFAFLLPGSLVLLVTFLLIHFNLVAPWIDKIEKVWTYVIHLFFTGSILSTNSIVRGFFWVLVTTLLAFIAKSNGQNPIIYFCVAGLIIIASVIEAAHAMAFQDELTGLPGRRSLNTALHGFSRNYTIAMLDIIFSRN